MALVHHKSGRKVVNCTRTRLLLCLLVSGFKDLFPRYIVKKSAFMINLIHIQAGEGPCLDGA